MRGTQLARQWKIIKLIESHTKGITVTQLANELEVPLRTVYRDLEAIQRFDLLHRPHLHSTFWPLTARFTSSLSDWTLSRLQPFRF